MADAIQLKLFITSKPNIALLDRIMKVITKMFMSHPDEILRSGDEIWLAVITMLFKLTLHPTLHRKRYCRRYLVVMTVTLVRQILKHISFSQVVQGIQKKNQHVKFRAVKRIIHEVFWDKRAEVDLCSNAQSIAREELRGMVDYINLSRANGIGFTYPRCEVCSRDVVESSQRANTQALNNVRYDPTSESLLIFDCLVESDYNHVFHARCLRNVIRDELRRDKKAGTNDNDILKQLRCIICYKKNQEINNMGVQRYQRTVDRKRNGASSARGRRAESRQ